MAMMAVVPALFYLLAFRMLCMRGGVADRHFRWQSDTLLLLRRTAYSAVTCCWCPWASSPPWCTTTSNPELTGTLGRLSLALFELGLAALTVWCCTPPAARSSTRWRSTRRLAQSTADALVPGNGRRAGGARGPRADRLPVHLRHAAQVPGQ
jgi:hypothetical protein